MPRPTLLAGLALVLVATPLLLFAENAPAPATANWPQWRGPNRDGLSTDTGLLKEWPKNGPPLLWEAKGAGRGYSSVAIAAGKIYTMGDGLSTANDKDEYLTCFADDAVWAMPDNPAVGMSANEKRGHAEIRAGAEERRASGLQGPGTDSRHVLTTVAVSVESDTRATARSYFQFYGTTVG